MKEVVKKSILTAIEGCFAEGSLTSGQIPPIVVEKPAHEEHGDFASNVAMLMAKGEKKPPRAVAESVVRKLQGGGCYIRRGGDCRTGVHQFPHQG